uniref:Uncharacterized protein n=1 Tax=Anopheles coluzzii TaxID=1518534 RepID=A0A6E8VTA7_ANOCL|nr:uncharacterized protein LOC120950109 [Anopheles coluzzii]
MGLPTFLNFNKNIQKHAMTVGVILTLYTIFTLLIGVAWLIEIKEKASLYKLDFRVDLTGIRTINPRTASFWEKEGFLVMGIGFAILAVLYWITYLMRQRLLLAVFIGLMVIIVTLNIIGMVAAGLKLKFVLACVVMFGLPVNVYMLVVALQLHKSKFIFTPRQQG